MAQDQTRERCTYCGRPARLTREHVHPAFLLRNYLPEKGAVYNLRLDKFLPYEGVVRDVCADCNSGPLSDLDEYGSQFADANRLGRHFPTRRDVLLRYDFDLLLRWLMKISYNTIRYGGYDVSVMQPWLRYILEGGQRRCAVALYCEVLRDHPLDGVELPSAPDGTQKLAAFPPWQLRSGAITGRITQGLEGAVARHVVINAFAFYILWMISAEEDSPAWRAMCVELRRFLPQAARLSPIAQSRRLRVSKRTCVEARQHQMVQKQAAWQRHVEARGGS